LIADEQGSVSCAKIPETNNGTYLRLSTWSVQNKDSLSSRKAMMITDTILIKSWQASE
jgi:hypothetical protein